MDIPDQLVAMSKRETNVKPHESHNYILLRKTMVSSIVRDQCSEILLMLRVVVVNLRFTQAMTAVLYRTASSHDD